MVFGYMNRNTRKKPELPIGPDNTSPPGRPIRGSRLISIPATAVMFRVRVPADFGKKELVWR